MTGHLGGAWCSGSHDRTGIVSCQNPDEPYDPNEPYASVATCADEKCIAKGIRHVAAASNRRATYYDDAERRAKKADA